MVSEFGCRWDALKGYLRSESGAEGVRVGSGGAQGRGGGGGGGDGGGGDGGGSGGPESASTKLGGDYDTARFDGRDASTRDPVGVWVAPNGVEVLTLRWAKRYGPGLQPLFAQVASFVGFRQPEWLVTSQKDHKGARRSPSSATEYMRVKEAAVRAMAKRNNLSNRGGWRERGRGARTNGGRFGK